MYFCNPLKSKMEHIVIILGVLFILEIKFSPRFHWYKTKKLFNILIYYKIQSNIGYSLRDYLHIKINLKK